MSDTQNYLRDMTQHLGPRHEPIASRPYTEMWEHYLGNDEEQYMCIIAPRQSGKTTALIDKFLSTPNSTFITSREMDVRSIRRQLGGHQHRSSDVISMGGQQYRGRRETDLVILDEFAFFRQDLVTLMGEILPFLSPKCRILAATTPSASLNIHECETFFEMVYLPQDWIDRSNTTLNIRDYFEEGLFEI